MPKPARNHTKLLPSRSDINQPPQSLSTNRMVAPAMAKYNSMALARPEWEAANYEMYLSECARSETMAPPCRSPFLSPKYRQHGYQDSGEDRQKRESPSPDRSLKRDNTFGPRAIQMPGTRSVSRCSQCGNVLLSLSEPLG